MKKLLLLVLLGTISLTACGTEETEITNVWNSGPAYVEVENIETEHIETEHELTELEEIESKYKAGLVSKEYYEEYSYNSLENNY